MGKSDTTKENIIEQTIILLKESDGNTDKLTIRKIAERAGIGVGLVNHYFESKDKLVTICVQRIINHVIDSFTPDIPESMSPKAVLKRAASQVMAFLMDNRQICGISIAGDLNRPEFMDNTMKTVWGFVGCISGGNPTQEDIRKCFMLTSVLQSSFLRRDVLKQSIGIDFYSGRERELYISEIVDSLWLNQSDLLYGR